LSRPLKTQIVEAARILITDEQHWCRRHLAEDVNGVSVSPTSASATLMIGVGIPLSFLTLPAWWYLLTLV